MQPTSKSTSISFTPNQVLSKLFGYTIYSHSCPKLNITDLPEFIIAAQEQNVQLLELFLTEKPDFEAVNLPNASLMYGEEKVSLHQKVKSKVGKIKDKKIVLCDKKLDLSNLSQKLLQQSRWYSRFTIDANFQIEEYLTHQAQQLKKADNIFIYQTSEDLQGILVLSTATKASNSTLNIDLLEFETIEVGKALLKRSHQFARENNLSTISITTQRANQSLCAFLKKTKFKESQVEFVYHLWLK